MQIIVDNIKTQYFEEGDHDKTILFLHGWRRDSSDFIGLSKSLKDSYKVLRLDLPGFGGTDRPANTWSVGDYANFVNSFLKKISLTTNINVLVGHSFGGRIILKGVGSGVLNAQKIILISPAGIKTDNLRKNIFLILAKIGDIFMSIPPIHLLKERLKRRFYKFIGSSYLDSHHMQDIFKVVVDEDLSFFAKQIDIPAMLIWGEHDIETPIEQGYKLSGLLKNSNLVQIKNTGHFSFLDKPTETEEYVKDFLKK